MIIASPNCFWLEIETVFLAASLACANTGNKIAARIAMMAITTKSSINVNAFFLTINLETQGALRESPSTLTAGEVR